MNADIASLAHRSDTAIAGIEVVLASLSLDELLPTSGPEAFRGGLVGLELLCHSRNSIRKNRKTVKGSPAGGLFLAADNHRHPVAHNADWGFNHDIFA